MILCPIAQFHRYGQLHPLFPAVAVFLTGGTLGTFAAGHTDLQGGALYVSCSPQARTRPAAEAPLEAHRTYIDVQVILAGTDTIGWSPLTSCRTESVPYDPANDIIFFREAPELFLQVQAGQVAVFFPEDAHAPLIGAGGHVRKLVVKVRVELQGLAQEGPTAGESGLF